jgi:uncharacterized protein (TIGR03067 family)
MLKASVGTIFLTILGLASAGLADEGKDDSAKKDLKKFEGTWAFLSLVLVGNPTPEAELKGCTAVAKGDQITLLVEGEERLPVSVKIDPAKKPAEIDFTYAKNSTAQGIYKLEEDRLTICLSLQGGRPKEFVSEQGSGNFLLVLKRLKH